MDVSKKKKKRVLSLSFSQFSSLGIFYGLGVFCLAFFVVFSDATAQFIEPRDQETIVLENRLNRQLENYLSDILPGNAFSVSTTVKTSRKKVKEIDVEVVDQITREQEQSRLNELRRQQTESGLLPPDDSSLPGLEGEIEDNTVRGPLNANENPLAYRFVEKFLIDQVSVQITLDNDVPQVTQDAIRRAVADRLETLYGANSNLRVVPVEMNSELDKDGEVNPVPPFNATNVEGVVAEETPLKKYSWLFYSLIFLIGMILFTLLVFALMMFIFRYLNRRERRKEFEFSKEMSLMDKEKNSPQAPKVTAPPVPPAPVEPQRSPSTYPSLKHPPPRPQTDSTEALKKKTTESSLASTAVAEKKNDEQDEAKAVDQDKKPVSEITPAGFIALEAQFLDVFLSDPLSGREYFLKLDPKNKNELYQALSSDSIKKQFKKIDPSFEEDRSIFEEKSNAEIIAIRTNALENAIGGIRQFRKLIHFQMTDPIGKLSLLKDEEVAIVFSRLPASSLVGLSKHIDSDIMLNYVRKLSEEKKRELLKEMSKPREEISQVELAKLKQSLNEEIKLLEQNIFLDRVEDEKLFQTIFAASRDSKGLLKEMESENKDIYNQYKQYAITFQDMLADSESQDFIRLVDSLDNDQLATISLGLPAADRDRLFSPLAEARREVVETIMFTKQGMVPKDQVLKAREELLSLYRDTKG